jgi:hypothetical protein
MNILDIVCLPNPNMRLSDLAYQYAFSPPSARAQPWNCTHAPNSAAPKTLVQPHPNSHPLKQSDRLRTFSARVLELTSSRCRSLSHGGRVLSLSLSLYVCVCMCASSDVLEGNHPTQHAMPPQSVQGQGTNSHVLGTRPSCRICGYFSLAEREATLGTLECGGKNARVRRREQTREAGVLVFGGLRPVGPKIFVVRERPLHRGYDSACRIRRK